MYTAFVVLGTMLAGAAVFTGILWLVYFGSCVLSERVAASGWGWLVIPNICVGPFAGAGLGFVGAIRYCGTITTTRIAAVFVGLAVMAFLMTMAFIWDKPKDGWPLVYTWRQGMGVVLRCAAALIAFCCFYIPLPLIAAIGLVVWGIASC